MSFLGLDIAISALRANQYALNVTGHNIANAGTQGYHRQEAVFLPGTFDIRRDVDRPGHPAARHRRNDP